MREAVAATVDGARDGYAELFLGLGRALACAPREGCGRAGAGLGAESCSGTAGKKALTGGARTAGSERGKGRQIGPGTGLAGVGRGKGKRKGEGGEGLGLLG